MNSLITRRLKKSWQHFISLLAVVMVAAICFVFADVMGYKVVALILLMVVTILAMVFDILPVMVSAVLSALIWNFFFIPPLFTLHIDNTEDALMFLMYFLIALVNTVLTFKIRDAEKKAREKEEKENTIKLYNTLLQSLSHEMRTPIATIIGAIDTLKENIDFLSIGQKTELLNGIEIASVRLNRQVTNLLSMSRLETGFLELKKDWCDINELIYSVIEKQSTPEHFHRITFEPDQSLPLFKLDAGLIENVMINLIHNAVQYTPENTIIHIVSCLRDDSLCIVISDQGNGFPASEIQYAFDKFYRLPNTKTGGTGLGLSIAKGFVQAHNGEIYLENNKEGGARFTLVIPAETTFISNLKYE